MNKTLYILSGLLLTVSICLHNDGWAKEATYGNAIVAQVINVYDGDTFRCDIAGYPPVVGHDISIRVYGIDTPEIKDKRPEMKALAIRARDYVRERLKGANTIELRNIRRGKYFRLVADVYVDGVSVAHELLKAGLAKPYDGGTKEAW